ncbi:hypothetical protein [Acinetobacter rongchengensis]|uniref:Uncharacterized protein n=1 Tax=Acinetobacter rongchengensis TaxID=2419601 RepID=A0A3A8FD88_9GAMM|nr:hypothetical protein [Acinetobacter rongchengensis]RKG40364.1 hypothetical protein D7V20_01615 [Acinetobacter rongchengensis]
MGLLFLIPILVCGFYFLSKSHFHRHKFQKLDGQQLYLKSALFGIVFTTLAFLLTSWLIAQNKYILFEAINLKEIKTNLTNQILDSLYGNHSNSDESKRVISFYIFFIFTFINSIICTWIGVKLYKYLFILKEYIKITNKFLKLQLFIQTLSLTILKIFPKLHIFSTKMILAYKAHNTGLESIKKEIKDPLSNLLYSSILVSDDESLNNSNKLLLLTMSDRKVYIGQILGFGKEDERFSLTSETFIFLPYQSGYRNKYDKSVTITTSYIEVIKNTDNLDEITIILNKLNIISAVKFDEKRFNSIPVNK